MSDPTPPLAPREVAAALRAVGAALRAELGGLPGAVLRWHPAPDEWCALEVVGHLIEAEERGFASRVRQLLAEEAPAFVPWDPDAVARERHDCGKPATALVDEFLRLREASVVLVGGLAATDLARSGQHPVVGRLGLGDLLAEWIHHDRNHMRQIMANVQVFVWPHMGNAQRFSAS